MWALQEDAGNTSSPQSLSFHSQIVWGLLSLALEAWAREPSMGLGTLAPQRRSPEICLTGASFLSPPPAVSCLLYILSYRTSASVQMVLNGGCYVIELWSGEKVSTAFPYSTIVTKSLQNSNSNLTRRQRAICK